MGWGMADRLAQLVRPMAMLCFCQSTTGIFRAQRTNWGRWGRPASPFDYQTALEIIRTGMVPVRRMIRRCLPLAEVGDSIKVIIEPQK